MPSVDAVDSFYQYWRARINAVTKRTVLGLKAGNVVAGMLDAQDWPNKNVKFDAFYLLNVGDVPIGRDGYSTYIPILLRQVQWVWINKGQELVQGIRQASRGTRFRTLEAMKGELLYASAPGYAPKLSWAEDNNDNWTGTPLNPPEVIEWKPLEFHSKLDKATGVIYGSAMTRLVDMSDAIAS
jgi:hypothetical protein